MATVGMARASAAGSIHHLNPLALENGSGAVTEIQRYGIFPVLPNS